MFTQQNITYNLYVPICFHEVYEILIQWYFHTLPDGIAWDWVTEKLYWTDECYNHIRVFDVIKGEAKTLFSGVGNNTRGIAVDPTTGYVPTNRHDLNYLWFDLCTILKENCNTIMNY